MQQFRETIWKLTFWQKSQYFENLGFFYEKHSRSCTQSCDTDANTPNRCLFWTPWAICNVLWYFICTFLIMQQFRETIRKFAKWTFPRIWDKNFTFFHFFEKWKYWNCLCELLRDQKNENKLSENVANYQGNSKNASIWGVCIGNTTVFTKTNE